MGELNRWDPAANKKRYGIHSRPSGKASHQRKADRQARFIQALVDGASIDEACVAAGIKRSTYVAWRERKDDFRVRVDELRNDAFRVGVGERVAQGAQDYRGDFASFRQAYFDRETYTHMREIAKVLQYSRPGSITLILCPPEAGKTSMLVDWMNFRLAYDPNYRITVVSEGQPHARKIIRQVAARMSDPNKTPKYYTRFGPFKAGYTDMHGKPWAADFFTVLGADHDEKDFSCEARGWRSAIAGTRTDLLIVDDIQSARSLNQTDQMVETFRQDFLTRPGREGRTVIIGTRVGVGDFYETLVMEDIVDQVVEFAAIDEDGNSYCPEMWPIEDLNRKRQIVGEDVWWRNYMQQPRRSGTQTFSDAILEPCKDIGRVIGQRSNLEDDVVLGVDPALTGPCGFAVYAYAAERFECLELWSVKDLASVENLVGHIERLAARYRPSTVVVEGNSFQRGLVHDERLAQLGRVYGFRVVQHTTHANKLDESIGVARIPTSMIAGQISFPYGDELARRQTDAALEEFRNWRPGVPSKRLRQDMVMASWFCWLHWRRWQDYSPRDVGLARMRALPWRPTANLLRAGT